MRLDDNGRRSASLFALPPPIGLRAGYTLGLGLGGVRIALGFRLGNQRSRSTGYINPNVLTS
jgi:hypothetical protein